MLPRRPKTHPSSRWRDHEAEQAIAEGRNAIQDLRSEPSAYSDLEHLLTAMGQELAGSQDANRDSPNVSVTVEGKRQAFLRSFRRSLPDCPELLRKRVPARGARQIEAEIRYNQAQLRLRIRDDGKGIDPRVLQEGGRAGHWGLPGIRNVRNK